MSAKNDPLKKENLIGRAVYPNGVSDDDFMHAGNDKWWLWAAIAVAVLTLVAVAMADANMPAKLSRVKDIPGTVTPTAPPDSPSTATPRGNVATPPANGGSRAGR